MSWVSTALYYRLVNEEVARRLGGLHSARCLLASVDFAEIARCQSEDRWEDAGGILAARARELEAAGADLLLLCTSTMHKVAEPIEAAIRIPFVHIVDVAAAAVLEAGIETVGLIGTRFTMEDGFFRDRLSRDGITVVVPDAAGRAVVHETIFDELVHDVFTQDSRDAFGEVITGLQAAGAGGVILGCTEIELLISPSDSPLRTFALTSLHAQAAVTLALEGPAARPKREPAA
jgi:aspartate racemase